ncbi:endonuclease/exonuclease/phosphatase family protein [Loktanella sp. SALINAS62]|uniref:endonuclease/exonuclease/phosphatase family protein n=1 Tax=Loktanella sp. SALINAS62 TaxID=2706124 RepID=UPI001B8CC255|nr:endonuclease/exonuclease/phosphatase family protein [Loktanella sp. SALINAS62]MBS1303020.1 endonuclease/exonuclease/phosphatase family protein [Loktanella sp. SALINAS62]
MRKALINLFGAATLIGVLATAMAELPVNVWWIRFLDFPRLQITLWLGVALTIYILLRRAQIGLGSVITLAGLVALGVQVTTLWAFQPIAAQMVPTVLRCEPDDTLRVLVTNVQRSNRHDTQVIDMARTHAPDVFIVMETSDWWDDALAPLQDDFAYSEQVSQRTPDHYGMQVYAQHPFSRAAFDYPLNSDTPMFDGRLEHPARPVHLLGVHPRPPHYDNGGQASTMRDATVLHAATLARDSDAISVIAGDFNATPWNDTTRMALRIGGLVDPRVGRGPMNNYKAGSDYMRWPLDQVLLQPGPGLLNMQILPPVGSDHQPVLVDLCLSPLMPANTIPLRDGDLDAAQDTFDRARALQAREG